MSRPIKFRAWDNTNKEWLLGYKYESLGGFDMFGECVLMGEWAAVAHAHSKGDIEVVLMQYTGLKDKNGVEVYEGDIVELPVPIAYDTRLIKAEVIYHEGCFSLRLEPKERDGVLWSLWRKLHLISVIGNIYEHGHLLENESKE